MSTSYRQGARLDPRNLDDHNSNSTALATPLVLLPKSEHAYVRNNMADISSAPADMMKTEYPDPSTDDNAVLSGEGKIEMDQEEIDAIIRNKRKVRDPKACYACHRRKVKCDRNLPCDSCVKRDHPELCSYERPTKKRRIALSNALAQAEGGQTESLEPPLNSGPNITVPKEQWERVNQELMRLRAQLGTSQVSNGDGVDGVGHDADGQPISGLSSRSDDGDREGVHAPSNQMGTMHLGSRSVLAYMIGNRSKSTQDAARSLLEDNILPNLGLDNETTTYPFVDLWSTDSSMQDVSGLCKALPDNDLCREFWIAYRDIPCTIYPVVPDKVAFEETLNFFLHHRAESMATTELDPDRPYGVTLPWLALLFAVLASGSQSSNRLAKERELTSQVYICCSYQALRMSNFLTHPSLETIEALLIIGNALSYNMNPGVAYILLGMTLRSALSMGLHVHSQNFSEQEKYLRGRIWWALAWQDSHFSVSYDRPSSSILCMPEIPYTKHSSPGNRSYVESMSAIIRLTQEILRDRALNPRLAMSWAMIQKYKDHVHRIWDDAQPRFRNKTLCANVIEHIERLALQIHCSYMISEICRPALKEDTRTSQPTSNPGQNKSPNASPDSNRRKSSLGSGHSPTATSTPGDPQTVNYLRSECVKYLEKTVETYVELYGINKFVGRSWIGIQRSISAAFLLAILPETRQEPRIIHLLTDLERCIEKSTAEGIGFPASSADQLDSPVAQGSRRLSGATSGSRQDMNDTPNWVRGMTKSLSALSKLNAALADGNSRYPTPGGQHYNNIGPKSTGYQHPSQGAAGVYNTPVVSPTGGVNATHGPSSASGPSSTTAESLSMAYSVPNAYSISGHGPIRHQPSIGGPNLPPPSGMMMGSSNLGPYAPDSANSDWHYGNLSERAMEYVQPGLWG